MELAEYVRTIRLRWRIIAAAVVATLLVGWFTLPDSTAQTRAPDEDVVYQATHTLVIASTSGRRTNLDRLVLYATTGAVPRRAAERLTATAPAVRGDGDDSDPRRTGGTTRSLRIGSTAIVVDPDAPTGSLEIVATDGDAARAAQAADVLADELKDWVLRDAFEQRQAQLVDLQERRATLEAEYAVLNQQSADALASGSPDAGVLVAKRDATVRSLADLEELILQVEQTEVAGERLQTLERARARPLSRAGFRAPTDRKSRLAIALALGAVLGLGIAFAIDRFDTRVRGVHAVEHAAHLPVIAEIPFVRMRKRDRYVVVTAEEPTSMIAESYRGLRTSLSLLWMTRADAAEAARAPQPAALPPADRPERDAEIVPKVILVTSPGPNEGKSVSSANLAACFAETGRRVILIDLDYRRQQLHKYLDADTAPALSTIAEPDEIAGSLDELLQATSIPNVHLVASAVNDESPARAIALARAAAQAASERADVVILDAPPLLLTNDTYDFLSDADAVLLVVRDGRSRRSAVSRASQLLRRLEAPLVGIAVVGLTSASGGGYGYYGYYGYGYRYGYGSGAERGPGRWLRRVRGRPRPRPAGDAAGDRPAPHTRA